MRLPPFDLINPLDELIARMRYGKMHRFTFFATPAFTGHKVEKLLRKYGVRIWGRRLVDDSLRSFVVRRKQAVWAEYVLCRAGVPLVGELLDPRNAEYPEQHPADSLPVPWTERGLGAISAIDHLGDLLARFVG